MDQEPKNGLSGSHKAVVRVLPVLSSDGTLRVLAAIGLRTLPTCACWLAAASVPCLMNLPIQPFISSKSVAVSRMSEVKVAQLCPTLCDPIGYTVHGILQARILEWVAIPFSGVSSLPRDWTQASCIAGGFFTNWAIRKAPLEWVCVTKVNLHLLTCYAKKPIYWHQFVGKGSTEFISCSKDPNSLMVSGKLFF